jgi:hypothetical protein
VSACGPGQLLGKGGSRLVDDERIVYPGCRRLRRLSWGPREYPATQPTPGPLLRFVRRDSAATRAIARRAGLWLIAVFAQASKEISGGDADEAAFVRPRPTCFVVA